MKTQLLRKKNWILAAVIAVLAGCGGGGGGSSDGGNGNTNGGGGQPAITPTNNLSAKSLVVTTVDPQIGYPLTLDVSIEADESTENVNISLFVVEKNDDPDADVPQFPLGSETLENVDAGESTHSFEMNITSSVELPGAYYVTAIVDPVDDLLETDEEDNTFTVEVTLTEPVTSNIYLDEVALDRASLEISTASYEEQVDALAGNIYNPDASATINVGADGIEADETIAIEAFASLRLSRSDTSTTHNVPLYLWNTTEARYINAYGVDPNDTNASVEVEWLPLGEFAPQLVGQTGDETSFDDVNLDTALMNFYFPGKLGSVMAYEMRYGHLPAPLSTPTIPPPDLTSGAISALELFLSNLPTNNIIGDESDAMAVMSFEICVEIRPTDDSITDNDALDNEMCAPLAITLPPLPPIPDVPELGGYAPQFSTPANPVLSSNGYKTKVGGKFFAFGLDFGTTASADYRGYVEDNHAAIPITVFGQSTDYIRIAIHAQLVPDYTGKPAGEESSFSVEYRHLGSLLDSTVEFPSDVSIAVELYSYSKEYPDPPKEALMWIGPVPLSVGASVAGNFGVDYEPLIFKTEHPANYEFGLGGGPYANIEATVYAAVGSKVGGFAAGVEGVLSLLDERMVFFNGVYIEVPQPEIPGYSEFVISQGPKITNVFTGPQGKINLFAVYTVPALKTCKIFGVKVKCPGFKKLKATKNLWSSKALFKFEDVIYENPSLELDVVIPAGEDPLYFTP